MAKLVQTGTGRLVRMGPGPSDDYKALLRGDIEADEYVRRLKADVNARMNPPRRTLTRRLLRRLIAR